MTLLPDGPEGAASSTGAAARRREASRALRAASGAALVALSLACTAATAGSAQPFTGAFSGSGRSCYGRLYVRTKTISWLTTFSQCRQVAYRIVEQHEHGNERALAFALKRRPKGCRYGVIYLRHRDDPDQSTAWEVIGYASLDDYRADQAHGFKGDLATSMSCSLVTE